MQNTTAGVKTNGWFLPPIRHHTVREKEKEKCIHFFKCDRGAITFSPAKIQKIHRGATQAGFCNPCIKDPAEQKRQAREPRHHICSSARIGNQHLFFPRLCSSMLPFSASLSHDDSLFARTGDHYKRAMQEREKRLSCHPPYPAFPISSPSLDDVNIGWVYSVLLVLDFVVRRELELLLEGHAHLHVSLLVLVISGP